MSTNIMNWNWPIVFGCKSKLVLEDFNLNIFWILLENILSKVQSDLTNEMLVTFLDFLL